MICRFQKDGLSNLFFTVIVSAIVSSSAVAGENQRKLQNTENLDPAVLQVLQNYQICVETVSVRAARKENPKLREKIFVGGMKGCDRSRVAELGIVKANQTQVGLDRQISAITDDLIADMRKDLGL